MLESIYDSQFSVASEHAVRLSLELPEDCAVATRADAPLVLEFVRLSSGGGDEEVSYPDLAPLVSVSCGGLAAGALRHLTRVLAQVHPALPYIRFPNKRGYRFSCASPQNTPLCRTSR